MRATRIRHAAHAKEVIPLDTDVLSERLRPRPAATRNVSDFIHCRVVIVDPWTAGAQ